MNARDDFRQAIFARDDSLCVICGAPAVDAHHIMERRLFPDGGYDVDNGVSLCADHHLMAEQTLLPCDTLRAKAGIKRIVLPPHLYDDEVYDKWGNPVLPNGQRLRGELFDDPSVQKVLAPVLSLFTRYIKYPRTFHLPWSPGVTDDDRALNDLSGLEGEVVVTEKMDGESTTFYPDYVHARSLEYRRRIDRDWVKNLHARIAHDIPEGWRVCGENLWGKHSIAYDALPSFFLVHSIWNDRNFCLAWDATVEWARLFELELVPVLYRGPWGPTIRTLKEPLGGEGFVIRIVGSFHYREFPRRVAKYVRKDHVRTQAHWTRQIEPNRLRT